MFMQLSQLFRLYYIYLHVYPAESAVPFFFSLALLFISFDGMHILWHIVGRLRAAIFWWLIGMSSAIGIAVFHPLLFVIVSAILAWYYFEPRSWYLKDCSPHEASRRVYVGFTSSALQFQDQKPVLRAIYGDLGCWSFFFISYLHIFLLFVFFLLSFLCFFLLSFFFFLSWV